MKVVAYTRVSTDRQAREGYGLDAQQADIKRWAKAEGHRIVEWFADEGISGANGIESRVGLYDALAAVRARTAGAIVVTSLDRLARALTQQEGILSEVWSAGGRVISLGDGGEVLEDDPDDPVRTAIRQMRGVFAQLERGLIRQRMAKGKRAKAAAGGYVGGAPPLGQRSGGGVLVSDPTETETVSLILNRHRDGLSLRQIIGELEAADRSPKRGGNWHPATVARVIARFEKRSARPNEGSRNG